MTKEPTPRERELARQIQALKDSLARPKFHLVGWLGDAVNAIARNIPVDIIRAALVIGVTYEAYDLFSKRQQQIAELMDKRASVTLIEAEEAAARQKIGTDTAEAARLKAEAEKLENEARSAEANARAQAQRIGDGTARLASLHAEIDAAANEAKTLESQVTAMNQNIAGLPLIVSKKRNEIEAAETSAEQEIWSQHLIIEGMERGDWRLYALGPLLGRNPEEDDIRRYSIDEIFNDLHTQVRPTP